MARTVHIDSLIVELTRRCNMSCKHCLRGNPQKVDLNKIHIDSLFEQIDSVYNIVLSGGEPSLAIQSMRDVLTSAKDNNVEISNFYVATNGKDISNDFVSLILDWYLYCTDNSSTSVEVSVDKYHEKQGSGISPLSAFVFYGVRGADAIDEYMRREGRFRENYRCNPVEKEKYCIDKNENGSISLTHGDIYLNAKGLLVKGCNWSYGNQHKHAIGHVMEVDLYEWISKQKTEYD